MITRKYKIHVNSIVLQSILEANKFRAHRNRNKLNLCMQTVINLKYSFSNENNNSKPR